jgi:renalase
MKRIAIIGAGMAGLTLAHQLKHKAEVTVFEKSRGVSGRLATRRLGEYEFDHGAQFFTARSEAFEQFIAPFIEQGVIAEWQPRVLTLEAGEKPYRRDWFEPHYVAVPRMNSFAKALAADLDIQLEITISTLSAMPNGQWQLHTLEEKLPQVFDWVISTAPASQSIALLDQHLSELSTDITSDTANTLQDVQMAPCFTLMLGFEQALKLPFQAARAKNASIEWIMVNSSKPGRTEPFTLVIQSSNSWARENLERDLDWVNQAMLTDLEQLLGEPLPAVAVESLHRWRYSRVEQALEREAVLDWEKGLAACGDWCLSGRVEGAFLSANSLARQLEHSL